MDLRLAAPLSRSRSLADLLAFERYVVVGANSGGDQVRAWLEGRGKNVVAFTDLRPEACGTARHGLAVMDALECAGDPGTAFVIGTVRQREAAELLIDQLQVAPARVFPFVNPMFSAHYADDIQTGLKSRLAAVRALLADGPSRRYFDGVVEFYRTLDARHLTPHPSRFGHYGYDAPGANPRRGDTIVDCGANIGDTFPDFLSATGGQCRIYALEAFLPNVEGLIATIARQNLRPVVTPLHIAVGRTPGPLVMSGDDSIADGCAHAGPGGARQDIVLCETLDNLFLKYHPAPVDYLKMDIEGADLDALEGGERLLRACRPVVAVAAYHTPAHVAAIAEYLQRVLAPCRLYAAHDPQWVFHIHYIAVPQERAA